MFLSVFNRNILEKRILGHINEIETHGQNYHSLQPLVLVFSGACFSHQELLMAMVMPVAQGKIRFVRSSGKIKFPRLWFLRVSVTLLGMALKRKDKYCSKFSGDFRI